MACATLKRSWEFDPVHSPGRPNKRPRCTPMCVSPTSSSPPPAKKSIFDAPKMTPDEMAASIRYQIERLRRRGHRNIDHGTSMNMSPTHSEGSNSDSEGMPMSPEPSHNFGSSTHITNIKKDTLFTYKQVQQICSRIVKEREDQLRQEYDEILNSKLSEQYDTFLKFSRDQIQRHFSPDNTPSSCQRSDGNPPDSLGCEVLLRNEKSKASFGSRSAFVPVGTSQCFDPDPAATVLMNFENLILAIEAD